MQPSRTSRRQIIVLDGSEVIQESSNPRTSSRQSSARTGQLQQGSDTPRASRQGPPVARTGSLDSGSRARHGTRATEQGSDNPGADTPHASRQGTVLPQLVAGTVLPQAPKAAGVAEYIVLAEADSTVPLAIEADLSRSPIHSLRRPVPTIKGHQFSGV